MEDIRLGRMTINTPRLVTIPATAIMLFDYSIDRTQLSVYPPDSGVITLAPFEGVTANQGITLSAGSHPVILDIVTHGDLLYRPWYAIHSVGGITTLVTEGRLAAR